MSFLTLRDQSNQPLVVNTDHVLFVAQAQDGATKTPLLGFSVIYLNCLMAQAPFTLLVKGSPEELKPMFERDFIELTQ